MLLLALPPPATLLCKSPLISHPTIVSVCTLKSELCPCFSLSGTIQRVCDVTSVTSPSVTGHSLCHENIPCHVTRHTRVTLSVTQSHNITDSISPQWSIQNVCHIVTILYREMKKKAEHLFPSIGTYALLALSLKYILLKFSSEPSGCRELGGELKICPVVISDGKILTETLIISLTQTLLPELLLKRWDSRRKHVWVCSLVLIFHFRLRPLIPSSFRPRPQIWVQHKHVTSNIPAN